MVDNASRLSFMSAGQAISAKAASHSPLIERSPGIRFPDVIVVDEPRSWPAKLQNLFRDSDINGWRLCNSASILSRIPPTVRFPDEQWSYGLTIPINHRALPANIEGITAQLTVTVQNGALGIFGVADDLRTLTSLERIVGEGKTTVALLLDRPGDTSAIVLRTISSTGRSPIVTLNSASAHAFGAPRLASRQHDLGHDLFIVLSPAKTATQTVERTLQSLHPAAQIRRTHFFSSFGAECQQFEMATEPLPQSIINSKLYQIEYARRLRDEVAAVEALGGNIAYMTATREPIGQIVADVFQLLPSMLSEAAQGTLSDDQLMALLRTQVMSRIEKSIDALSSPENLIWGPKNFYSHDLLQATGVDVLQHPWQPDNGVLRIKKKNADVAIYRFEDITFALAKALSQLTGRSEIVVFNSNLSEEKSYASLYKKFKADFKVPPEICAALYENDPYFRHFYSNSEIAAFAKRWSA